MGGDAECSCMKKSHVLVFLALCLTLTAACATSQAGAEGKAFVGVRGQEMARRLELGQVLDELTDAFKWGDEAHARDLVFQLGQEPHEIRAVLEAMLEDSYGLARQAAAFGLGELGGAASVSLLERQIAIEEARDDYDGEAVVEDIVNALGRIDEASARAALVRKLERMVVGKPELSDVNVLAHGLWRRRHPDLIPVVRQSLDQFAWPAPHAMHQLLVLLEKSPRELDAWARDPAVSAGYKRGVLAVLEGDVPDSVASTFPAFIATAQALLHERGVGEGRETVRYCERLFSVILGERARFLTALPLEARTALRAVALNLISETSPDSSLWAAAMLEAVGRPEDAAFIEAHCPADPVLAQVFNDAARALHGLQKN